MSCVWNDKYVLKVYRHMEILGIVNVKHSGSLAWLAWNVTKPWVVTYGSKTCLERSSISAKQLTSLYKLFQREERVSLIKVLRLVKMFLFHFK